MATIIRDLPSLLRVPVWVWAGRLGSLLTIVGAILLAVIHHPSMKLLFVIWTISNTLWVWYGLKTKSGALVSAQVVFLLIDVVGVTHYWIIGNAIWMVWMR